jgi:hypothetical protein
MKTELAKEIEEIGQITSLEVLKARLINCLGVTLENVLRLAAIVKRIDELGFEVSISSAVLPYIRKIAHGQLMPELFVTLQGDQVLLDKAMCLSIPEQKLIAENKPIRVMEIGGDHRKVPPMSMTRREIKQVFGRGAIRNDSEQIGWLRDQQATRTIDHEHQDSVFIDRKRKGIIINGKFLSVVELESYVRELSKKRKLQSL